MDDVFYNIIENLPAYRSKDTQAHKSAISRSYASLIIRDKVAASWRKLGQLQIYRSGELVSVLTVIFADNAEFHRWR